MIAVSDMSGGVLAPDGLDIPTLHAHVAEHGSLEGFENGVERITNETLLELECDILVLAAREDQVTGANAGNLRCRLVAEGANGPTSNEGDRILAERGIPVLPDILVNAGGVTVSYFEWVQDLGRLFWDRDEIRRRLADKMSDAFDRVWDALPGAWHPAARRGARRRDPRSLRGARGARRLSVGRCPRNSSRTRWSPSRWRSRLRAPAQAAGEALARPDVRAVFVCDDGTLVGVVTRKTLVREVVAPGRRSEDDDARSRSPSRRTRRSMRQRCSRTRSRTSRSTTTSASRSSTTASSSECSSRAVVQRRLAEDEEVPGTDGA